MKKKLGYLPLEVGHRRLRLAPLEELKVGLLMDDALLLLLLLLLLLFLGGGDPDEDLDLRQKRERERIEREGRGKGEKREGENCRVSPGGAEEAEGAPLFVSFPFLSIPHHADDEDENKKVALEGSYPFLLRLYVSQNGRRRETVGKKEKEKNVRRRGQKQKLFFFRLSKKK